MAHVKRVTFNDTAKVFISERSLSFYEPPRQGWIAEQNIEYYRDLNKRYVWPFGNQSKPMDIGHPDKTITDFGSRRPPFDDDARSVCTVEEDYDPAKHNPVFYSSEQKLSNRVRNDDVDLAKEFDPSKFHPATVGYSFVDKPPASPPPPPPTPPHKDKCSPTKYLEHYVFPTLLPAMEEMLKAAKEEKCFERKRTKFNAADFLTEYLYSNNNKYPERKGTKLEDIPFVKEHWKEHPRPPLPKSLIWSEAEAILIIQSFWRGYKVRLDPDVQELRHWQKEWKEENANIKERVDDFWAKKMPEDGGAANTEQTEQKTSEEVKPSSAGAASDRPRSVVIKSPQEGL